MATVNAICVLSADGGSGVSGTVQMSQSAGAKISIKIQVNVVKKKNLRCDLHCVKLRHLKILILSSLCILDGSDCCSS